MKENLYYLFLTGLIFGSGPCLSFCAPLLVSYAAIRATSLKKSTVLYLVFSLSRLLAYMILGALCALSMTLLRSRIFEKYTNGIYLGLGCFIILIGITTLVYKESKIRKACSWLHKGNVRNVGILGLLIGFSPCLPLLGILNYIMIISKKVSDAILFSFVFGLGTVVSPLALVVILSGKVSQKLSENNKLKVIIRVICAATLIFLGAKIILQTLLR